MAQDRMSYQGMSMPKEPEHSVHEVREDSDIQRKKIVLCFDGTSNQFKGDDSDTNVVKIFQMLDRSDKHQYHYYQPGIGTYRANSALQNTPSTGLLARTYARVRSKADEALASTFADHVMAGYKFLMRYYMEDDKIYVFGFSRGAYTARFLCELIKDIGLLSKGNEEMVPFIWYQYIDWRADPKNEAKKAKIQQMRQTFCRPSIGVFWLGLWDCVSSVAELSGPGSAHHAPRVDEADPNIAIHVRHAVSSHERRVKFRPTLFIAAENDLGTFKEQWFAGNHGDVGGGWKPNQGMLLSDIPLMWMVEELQQTERRDGVALSWRWSEQTTGMKTSGLNTTTFDARRRRTEDNLKKLQQHGFHSPDKFWHDVLDFKRSNSPTMVPFWWFMECLPLKHTVLVVKRGKDWIRVKSQHKGQEQTIMRKETSHDWHNTMQPNFGRYRNIPLDAVFHPSVKLLHDAGVIKSMAKWQFGPVGYNALVKSETMPNGHPSQSLEHDHYMFVC